MKRNLLVGMAVAAVVVLSGIGAYGYYVFYTSHIYHPEVLEPEVFERMEFDTDLLIGVWRSGTVFYRYNEDGTGFTWDTSDDVTEAEASFLEWQVEHASFTHQHKMEMGSVVPKHYRISNLDLQHLVFKDDFGKVLSFEKVE